MKFSGTKTVSDQFFLIILSKSPTIIIKIIISFMIIKLWCLSPSIPIKVTYHYYKNHNNLSWSSNCVVSHHPSLSSIALGRSSVLHPVSIQGWCLYWSANVLMQESIRECHVWVHFSFSSRCSTSCLSNLNGLWDGKQVVVHPLYLLGVASRICPKNLLILSSLKINRLTKYHGDCSQGIINEFLSPWL